MCNDLLLTLSLTDGDGCIRGRVGKEKDKSYSIGQKEKQTNTVLQLWPISLSLSLFLACRVWRITSSYPIFFFCVEGGWGGEGCVQNMQNGELPTYPKVAIL